MGTQSISDYPYSESYRTFSMLNRLRNKLHEKVHGAKISRQKRQVRIDSNGIEECETSSASSLEQDPRDVDQLKVSTTFAIEVCIRSVVDLPSSPSYFYVCIGEEGEPTSRKKSRGIQTSGVLYGKSPKLSKAMFLLPMTGITFPELTVRFSRSALVGSDAFLGECRLKINLKGSLDSMGEEAVLRLEGAGSAVVCLEWRLLPFDCTQPLEKRSNILPETNYTTEIDKLNGLVESIGKTLTSLSESIDDPNALDSPLKYKNDFLLSVFNMMTVQELDYVLSRVSVTDLVRLVPRLFDLNSTFVSNLKSSCDLSVLNLSRIIRSLVVVSPHAPEIVAKLIVSCIDPIRLQELKYLISRGGDKVDLTVLVNHIMVGSKVLRDLIINHFHQFSTSSLGIVSEIDHVVYTPFGSTRLWQEGRVPGFKSLFDSLSNDVLFVPNRPISSLSETRKIVREIGMADTPVLMSSSSFSQTSTPKSASIKGGGGGGGGGGLVQRLQHFYSESVAEAWKEYSQLFPKRTFIWFVESVQLAETMITQGNEQGIPILAIVMGDVMVGRGGPVLVDHESGRIVACANYVQAALACLDYGYLDVETIEQCKLLVQFQKHIDELVKSVANKKTRHKHLIKERIADMRFDLQRLVAKVQALIRKSGLGVCKGDVAPTVSTEELVDSVILTPIEALSPTLTNHSRSPGPMGIAAGSYDSEIILTGV